MIHVKRPDIKITIKSNKANGVFPTGSNKNPLPNLNNFPPVKISSPIYITSVVAIAAAGGIITDNNFLFL